jgi:hypothetical protein
MGHWIKHSFVVLAIRLDKDYFLLFTNIELMGKFLSENVFRSALD